MRAGYTIAFLVAIATYGLREDFYKFSPLQRLLSKPEHSQEEADDIWTLSTNTFAPGHYQTAPYVANGYFGQTLPTEGVGYWVENDGSLNDMFQIPYPTPSLQSYT